MAARRDERIVCNPGTAKITPGLEPGGDQHGELHRGELEAVGAIVEVALIELLVVQLLDRVKAGSAQLRFHCVWGEEELERLAGSGDTGGQRIEGDAADGAEGLRREAVIEAHGAALGELSNCAQGVAEGGEREVRNDSKPAEERGRLQVETGVGQLFGQRVVLEVEGHKGEIGGQRDLGFGEHFPLPLLGGWKVNFEDAQRGKGTAIGKGVETCAEDHVLADTLRDCVGELVFNIAAAHCHEGAKVTRDAMHGALHLAGMGGADQADGDGVKKNRGVVHQLVGGAADGHTEGGFAGAASLHTVEFK